jgi:hypothetical protein
MMERMKIRRLLICTWLACLAIPTTVVRADDDLPDYDARTMGYPANLTTHMEGSSTLGAYFLFVFLMLVTVGVMLKNSNRSHLD